MDLLIVRHLSKRYGKKEEENSILALKDVNFSIKKGEFVVIIGDSGSGKSTLLNIIGGLDKQTDGEVIINNQNISMLSDKQLTIFRRKNIGFIFQDFNLIPELTVVENIILPLLLDHKKPDMSFLKIILQQLDLENRKDHLPSQLSGGQQQRVAIGRAIITKPSIILADEPTGNLDSKNSDRVINLLKEMSKNYEQTIIMITHNEKYVGIADQVLSLSDGLLTEKRRVNNIE